MQLEQFWLRSEQCTCIQGWLLTTGQAFFTSMLGCSRYRSVHTSRKAAFIRCKLLTTSTDCLSRLLTARMNKRLLNQETHEKAHKNLPRLDSMPHNSPDCHVSHNFYWKCLWTPPSSHSRTPCPFTDRRSTLNAFKISWPRLFSGKFHRVSSHCQRQINFRWVTYDV